MIPSLVARELRDSIVEYLATTFALSEDAAYQALVEFLQDAQGIFRVRTSACGCRSSRHLRGLRSG